VSVFLKLLTSWNCNHSTGHVDIVSLRLLCSEVAGLSSSFSLELGQTCLCAAGCLQDNQPHTDMAWMRWFCLR
jgi:hypothetical protein